jgi:inward rectifier potassium channel
MIHRHKKLNPENVKDLGFGTSANSGNNARLINRDGSFNVIRKGLRVFSSVNFYHIMIKMSWLKFITVVSTVFVLINFIFAGLYWLVGIQHLAGLSGSTPVDQFFDALFFSAQTITTVGYGRISPMGVPASILAAIESLMGVLGFALATGLLYGRFSRPEAKIIFSENAIIAPYRGIQGFEFRIANMRTTQLIEVEVQVVLAWLNKKKNMREFKELVLERTKVNFLPLSWTIVHPIDEESPLYEISKEELEDSDAEFIILIKAFDDAFAQTIYARSSYTPADMIWNAKFSGIFEKAPDGKTIIDVSKISAIEMIDKVLA